MHYSLLTLALSTLTLAAPITKQDEFAVYFSVSGSTTTPNFVSANLATPNGGKNGHFILKGERLSVYPGLPAYFSGGTVNKDLIFDTTSIFGDGTATAIAPQIGSTPGIAKPIEVIEAAAEPDVHDLSWGLLEDGEIYHLQAQEGNRFYSCTQDVQGTEYAVLSWGNPTVDGKAPEGCVDTKVVKGAKPQ